MSKKVVFEGRIDGVYSQIFFDETKNQWFLMQKIKDSERSKAMLYAKTYNHGKAEEEKLAIETKMFNDKRSRFLVGRISERKAVSFVEKNQGNQIRTETRIKDVPKYSDHTQSFLRNKSKMANVVKSPAIRKGAAVIASLLIAGAVLQSVVVPGAQDEKTHTSSPNLPGTMISQTFEEPVTPKPIQPEQEKPQESPKIELEDVVLKIESNGSLTSESVRNLTGGIVNELSQLYEEGGGKLPPVADKDVLASLFYAENTLKPVDTTGEYVGIGQMGKSAVKTAIERANKLYSRIDSRNAFANAENYIVDNICSKGNKNLDEQVNRLWEQSKTDAKMCGCLTGLYLADLSDRYENVNGGNKASVIIMYNAGEGNFQNYQKLGIVSLSGDKTGMTVDLEQVDKLPKGSRRTKWNEAVNYVIKVLQGSERLKQNPNADVKYVCEQTRLDVGKNDNNSSKPNMNQYNFAPEGVKFVSSELNRNSQPGE